jgi:heme-degrading monooxygenase HmoA
MIARVTFSRGEANPEREEEATRIVERTLQALRQRPGFGGAYILANRQSGVAMGVTLWESEDAYRRGEAEMNQMRSQTTDLTGRAAPVPEFYEVALQHTVGPPAPEARGGFARVTTVQGQPGQMINPEIQERGLAAARQQPGFKALYVLTDQRTGKFLVMTLWETEEQALAREEAAAPLRREALTTMGITAAPSAEVYEVAVQV